MALAKKTGQHPLGAGSQPLKRRTFAHGWDRLMQGSRFEGDWSRYGAPKEKRQVDADPREDTMGDGGLTRRTVLRAAGLTATALAVPFVRSARAGNAVASGSMVLAWHTNIAPRWLDPQQHDGGATPDNFLNVVQDALIKNFRDQLYDLWLPKI